MSRSLEMSISYGSLLRFALPTIVSNVFMNIYTTVDGIFVSNLVGTDALSAVNIVYPFLMIAMALAIMIGTGGCAFIAAQLGEGRRQEARQNFSMLMVISAIGSVVIVGLALAFREPVLRFLGANDAIYHYCEDYATILFISGPFAVMGMLFQMFFIAEGRPNLGMIFSVIGGVLNIVLDYVFIALMDMGIRGAALATGIGYGFPSITGALFFALNRRGNLCFRRPVMRPRVLAKVASNGASEMVVVLSLGIVTIMMNVMMMELAGEDGVAAITIILYAQGLLSSLYMGYTEGVAPVVSYNYGKGDEDGLRRIHGINLRVIGVFSAVTLAVCFAAAEPLVIIFAPRDTYVYALAMEGFRVFGTSFAFMGFNIYSSSLFTALNDGRTSAMLSFLRTLVFLAAALLVLPRIWGIMGLWVATPAAELLGFGMTLFFFIRKRDKFKFKEYSV